MAICSLVEDYGLVGFETLAVEVRLLSLFASSCLHASIAHIVNNQDKESMLNLTRAIDKATGCVFVPSASAKVPKDADDSSSLPASKRPNEYGLLSSAMAPLKGPRSDPRDVQERWIDARDEWDAWEKAQWRQEGMLVQQAAKNAQIRERHPPSSTTSD